MAETGTVKDFPLSGGTRNDGIARPEENFLLRGSFALQFGISLLRVTIRPSPIRRGSPSTIRGNQS
jgi:hypothetical protein